MYVFCNFAGLICTVCGNVLSQAVRVQKGVPTITMQGLSTSIDMLHGWCVD